MTAVAGWVDAVGIMLFLSQLQIFPTYMSGNTTRMFVAASQGQWRQMGLYGLAIVLFVVGAACARLVNSGGRWRESCAMLAEGLLLLTAAFAAAQRAPDLLNLGLLAAAMGWNNVALKSRNGVGPKGYITGTLVSIATGIGEALMGRGRWSSVGSALAVWSALAFGALAGALSTRFLEDPMVLLVPAVAIGLCALGVAIGLIPVDEQSQKTEADVA
ncbi:MAG: YoaK family protein [Rubrivivax sp.]